MLFSFFCLDLKQTIDKYLLAALKDTSLNKKGKKTKETGHSPSIVIQQCWGFFCLLPSCSHVQNRGGERNIGSDETYFFLSAAVYLVNNVIVVKEIATSIKR
jgi:hypothetical protein